MGILELLFGRKQPVAKQDRPVQSRQQGGRGSSGGCGQAECQALAQKLEGIFSGQFGAWKIGRQVPVTVLDPRGYGANVDFLFCDAAGRPKLAVVIVTNSTWTDGNVMSTMRICERLRIPYMRFFPELPNEPGYVVNRVAKALK